MSEESGTTLAEVLVGLLILSGLAVILGEASWNTIQSWSRADADIERTRDLAALYDPSGTDETAKRGQSERSGEDTTDGGFVLATGQIDRPADCVFDLVGRRCR